jgi:hypothetical protein
MGATTLAHGVSYGASSIDGTQGRACRNLGCQGCRDRKMSRYRKTMQATRLIFVDFYAMTIVSASHQPSTIHTYNDRQTDAIPPSTNPK